MTKDINKEFEEKFGAGPACYTRGICPPQPWEIWNARREGYIAAAVPRDLLIEQLVKALKEAQDRTNQPSFGMGRDIYNITDTALSAAKERGYGEG